MNCKKCNCQVASHIGFLYNGVCYDCFHKEEKGNKSKFYFFNQNNSGGDFDVDDNLAEYVFIEAYNHEQANNIAIDIGIYFNGVEDGLDCECCGDRWCDQYDDNDGSDIPTVYGTDLRRLDGGWFDKGYRIHYLNKPIERGVIKKR